MCGLLILFFSVYFDPVPLTHKQENKAVQAVLENTAKDIKFLCHAQSLAKRPSNNYTLNYCPHSTLAPIYTHLNPRPPTERRKRGLLLIKPKLPVID